MCWNVMMAVTVCGDHLRYPSNVMTRRGGRHHTTLAPHWSRVRPAGLWLAGCWPRGHTRTRDTGTCDLVLTRHLHLQPHSPHTGSMANIRSPTLKLLYICVSITTPQPSPGPLTAPLTYTTFYARSYHPQHQNVQSSIKSQRWSVVKVISLETINTKTPSHIQLAITFWTRDIFPSLSNQDLKIINPSINHQYSKLTLSENRILKNFSFNVVCWNSISHESLILYWVTGAKSCIKLIQPRQQQLPLH